MVAQPLTGRRIGVTRAEGQLGEARRLFEAVDSMVSGPTSLLWLLIGFLLVLGAILDIFSAIVLVVPLLLPVAAQLVAGSAHRQIARNLGCSHTTVTRMAARLGRHALLFLARALEEIRSIDEPIVVYCGSGVTACSRRTIAGAARLRSGSSPSSRNT